MLINREDMLMRKLYCNIKYSTLQIINFQAMQLLVLFTIHAYVIIRFFCRLIVIYFLYSSHRNANFYLSNRISYALGLCGPSFTLDTACSISAYALDCAFRYMESGIYLQYLLGLFHLLFCALSRSV
jgi:acyl transferase domain-containing protein